MASPRRDVRHRLTQGPIGKDGIRQDVGLDLRGHWRRSTAQGPHDTPFSRPSVPTMNPGDVCHAADVQYQDAAAAPGNAHRHVTTRRYVLYELE